MEHPVPQNVTAFEFHLVGDMTLKQFGYLGAGLLLAYITFTIVFSRSPIIAIPFMIIFALTGAAFAFLNPWEPRGVSVSLQPKFGQLLTAVEAVAALLD